MIGARRMGREGGVTEETLDAGAALNGVDREDGRDVCPHPSACANHYRECVAAGEAPCRNAPSRMPGLSKRETQSAGFLTRNTEASR